MTNQSSEFTNNWEDTVQTELSTTGTSLIVADASGLAVPCFLTLDYDDPAKLEIVRVTSKVSNTLTVTRYLAGSAQASGLTHLVGATVKQAVVGQMFEDLHDRLEGHAHTGGADGSAVSVDHGATSGLGDDDHTQYLKEKANGGLASEVPEHTHASAAEGGQFDHGNAAGLGDDDHPHYLTVARHDADDHSDLEHVLVTWSEPGTLATKTGAFRWYIPYNCVITEVQLAVGTNPTGAALIIDVNVDGTTIDTGTKPQIAAGSQTGTDSTFTDATHNKGQLLSIDIDQVGSTVAGSDLTVNVLGKRV